MFDKHSLKSSSICARLRYFVLSAVIFENPASHKYVDAKGRRIFKATSQSSGYSCINQGSRVRPNFSRVRLTKIPGRTGASSHSRKEKKVSATQKLCGSTKDTPVRLISWSKPIRDSEGRTPPLIGCGPDIPVCVCARWQMLHVCCCSQTERKRWVVEMRAVLPT